MFRLLKFLFIIIALAIGVIWLVNNNGEVVINWLGYEIVTDVFMIVVLTIVSLIFIFVFAYFLTKIFSFKIKKISEKITNIKNAKKLKKMEKGNDVAYLQLTQILAYLDEGEVKLARSVFKKFCANVKNEDIIEYLKFRFGYFESDAYKKNANKKTTGVPGISPENDKEINSYFNFASKKGWKSK